MHDDLTYLGMDVGTSDLRQLLISGAGKPIGATEACYGTQNLYPGWSEQDPDKWIVALNSCTHELNLKHAKFPPLNGIVIAGHMYGACLLDKTGSVIRPCILSNDTRSHREARELDQLKASRKIFGNIIFLVFTSLKLAWIKKNELENFSRIARVLLPAVYLKW